MSAFTFGAGLTLYTDPRLDNPSIHDLFRGFTDTLSSLTIIGREAADCPTLTTNPAPAAAELPEGKAFRLTVGGEGISLIARDYPALVKGFMCLLCKLRLTDYREGSPTFTVPETDLCDNYKSDLRMLHLCYFEHSKFSKVMQQIREAAVMQYTHVCIEFWASYPYECMPELAFENTLTRSEAAALVAEIRKLGMEPIPMFNMLGHAQGCGQNTGKHVVLDRFPQYSYLFTPDGWGWNIARPDVAELLSKLRHELYELFGEGSYFCIGCDEYYQREPEFRSLVPGYLHDLTCAVLAEGRTPIMWADNLLNAEATGGHSLNTDGYVTFGEDIDQVEALFRSIAPETLLADWQYYLKNETTCLTSEYLINRGFKVLGCPWYQKNGQDAIANTPGLTGYFMTTWSDGRVCPGMIWQFAEKIGAVLPFWLHNSLEIVSYGALVRRISQGLQRNGVEAFGY